MSVNWAMLGIHLTQVTPTYSVRRRGGLSADADGVRHAVRDRSGVSGLPDAAAMARRVSMPCLRRREGLGSASSTLAVRGVWAADLDYGRHHLSGHQDAADYLVSRDVVGHKFEDRDQCSGAPAGVGTWQLSDRVDLAAQTSARHGEAWSR